MPMLTERPNANNNFIMVHAEFKWLFIQYSNEDCQRRGDISLISPVD